MNTTDIATRPCFPREVAAQIGNMNILAISGGRISPTTFTDEGETFYDGVYMPVAHGHGVEVRLAANDTYTVRHVFTRSGRRTVRREWTEVYCDQVGEIAFEASCFRDA